MIEVLDSRLKQDGTWSKPRLQILEIYDRKLGKESGKPIAHLLLERLETIQLDERDGSVFDASINLRYQRILSGFDHRRRSNYQSGSFVGRYRKLYGRLSLTSRDVYGDGAVFLDLDGLDGQRIATYMLNEVVTWAKQWPDAEVKTITLNAGNASDDNKERRNRLYEQFNIVFDYDTGSDRCSGRSRPMRAGALTAADTWTYNIVERPLLDYIAELVEQRADAVTKLDSRDQSLEVLGDRYSQAVDHPIRWAARTVLARNWRRLIGILGVAALFLWCVPSGK